MLMDPCAYQNAHAIDMIDPDSLLIIVTWCQCACGTSLLGQTEEIRAAYFSCRKATRI